VRFEVQEASNVGALTLAKLEPPLLTQGSKQFAIKYHWFREHLHTGDFDIEKVSMDLQLADIFD
jgi:hypothetical protein